MPRSTRTEHGVARVRRASGVAESSANAGGWIETGGSEIRAVEDIEKLRTELGAIPLLYMPYLGDGNIDVVIGLAAKDIAVGVADRPVSRQK